MLKSIACVLFLSLAAGFAKTAELDIWIGTAAEGGRRGLYQATFDSETGKLSPPKRLALVDKPGFLALHPRLPLLYTTGVRSDGEHSLFAYRIERSLKGSVLRPRGRIPTGAGAATHISVDKTGNVLLAAFYGSGKVAAFPLDQEGLIGPRSALIEHTGGSGVVAGKQKGPHPHWSGVSPDNRFAFVPDLGTDRLHHYRLDTTAAMLTPAGTTSMPPGGGPRHMAFHPNGRWAYVVNELAMSLTVLEYQVAEGTFQERQTIPTLSREQREGESFNSGSEVCIHPTGRFVYSANRGHDSITVFIVDQSSGELSLVEHEPIRGAWPRHFTLTPDGDWLLAAGRNSNTLAVFRVSPGDGRLQYARQTASVPVPICVVAAPAR